MRKLLLVVLQVARSPLARGPCGLLSGLCYFELVALGVLRMRGLSS